MLSAILRFFGLSNASKAIGATVGAAFGYLVSLGLPGELATPEMQAAVTVIVSGVVAWLFPANIKA